MLIKGDPSFDWDDGNVSKNQKHGISKPEIEEFFRLQIYVSEDLKHSNSEQRFMAIGQNSNGKYMIVVFTIREESIRPISARHMNKREIENYEKEITKVQNR
jgi:uncharacterized DUF497 family protein